MKRAGETNEVEIMDGWHYESGGELGWSVFGEQRLTAEEILSRMDEGLEDEPTRAAVLRAMLDLCLGGWSREANVNLVGERAVAVASACCHRAGDSARGMLGARGKIESAGLMEEARRILDWWFFGSPSVKSVGKRLVAIGKFLNHGEFEGWSLTQLGKACGETPAAMSWRVNGVCNKALEAAGGRGRATWQQGAEQREGSSRAQKIYHKTKSKNKPQE